MKIRNLIFFAAASLVVSCSPTEEKLMEKSKASGIEISNMNTEVKPGNDFFEYANGGWLKANPMPEEYSRYGAFEILAKKNQAQIKGMVEEISAMEEVKKGSPEQQIRDFYNAGMDTSIIEELGMSPIQEILADINNMATKDDIVAIHAKMNFNGSYPLFAVFGSQDDKNSANVIAQMIQGGLGLPDRDYYIKDDERISNIRKEYVDHITKIFVLTGDDETIAAEKANNVLAFETKLAAFSMTMLERRNPNATYNIKSMDELQNSAPGYNFEAYFKAIGISNTDVINVRQPKFMTGVAELINSTDLENIKTYFAWNILNDNAGKLNKAFVKQNFYFYSTVLSGVDKMKPRWKRMISSTNGNLGDPVGKIYVEKFFPAESKERMLALVGNLRIALKESIDNLDWMGDSTKVKAQEKLAAITVKVGYPNKWIDYTSVDIDPNKYLQNTWNCAAFSYKRNIDEIGKPVDREEWGMTPQTVNAYYSPNMNEIVFPAAILQPPFFDANADDAVNYGAIGVVIGHEMTHGFDDQGRLYDKDGNLNEWWTETDAIKFKEKTKILVEQYNAYTVLDSLHVDGELTLGENIADNGGLFIAYDALQMSYAKNGTPEPIDGLTSDQRYLIAYAQLWRQHIRPKTLMRRLQEDVHSPGDARVNQGVVNTPWFYTAFDVKEGDDRYVAPENRAQIW
ncbi:MAG: M13 family metallopeptidase [Bacteroidales bacterium]|nr:M13 family metallopeptidase [Bacteroidales bacterium]